MGTEKKLVLYRLITALLAAALAFQVGSGAPCLAHETHLREKNQTNFLAFYQNVPDLISSDIETGITNTIPPGEYRRDDPVKKSNDGPRTRTVRVGIYQNPPKVFIDEKGLPAGIFVDLLNEIARKENWNLVYVPCEWSDCLEALEEHRIDLMPDVAYSRERDEKYDFHKTPVVDSWSQVYANSSIRVSTLSDLNGRRIAVLKKGIQEETFEQMMNGFGYTVTLIEVKTYKDAFGLTAHGSVDAVLSNHFIGDYLYLKYGLTKTPIVFNPSSLYFVTAQGRNRELLDAIERNLDSWRSQPDSYYYQTLARWSEKPPVQAVPRYLIWIIVITGGFLVLSGGIILLLRAQVRAKTGYLVEANESLKKSEGKYRSLVENLNDVIFNLDAQGNITYMSPVAESIFSYRPEEVIGRPFSEYIHPDDLPGVMESRGETQGGMLEPYEFRMVDKNDSIHYVRTSSRPIERDGRHVGMTGILTDITGERQAEQALRASETRYRRLFEAANDGILILDADTGRIVDVNPFIETMLGYSHNELLGKELWEISVFKDIAANRENFLELQEKGYIRYEDLPLQTKDGRAITVEFVSNVYLVDHAKVVQCNIRDITGETRSREALRDSEEKFRSLFLTSRDFLFITDFKGTIIDTNYVGFEFLGYSREEISGMQIHDLYANPEDRQEFTDKILKSGYVTNNETKLKKKSGEIIDVLMTVNVRRDKDGNPIGFFSAAKDITEKKKMEQQLLQTEKLSAVGTMISGVAHELNNPLTAIIGNAQLLARRDVPEDIKSKLDVILKESIRSSKIVGGLLAFAREHKPERSMINVNDIVMECVKLKEYDLRVNNINLELTLADDLPDTFADPYQIQQVFINLINNARDALIGNQDKGVLAITTHAKDDVILTVFEDSGPGIPDEFIDKIFEPFFTTKETGKGTGLGLSMAYGILKEHGGTISVESKPGKGARFVVRLPITSGKEDAGEETEEEKTESDHTSRNTKSILVVEDEENLAQLISEALSSEGYQLDCCSNGETAIEKLKKKQYDLIISDMKMPRMSGKELYLYIQKNYPGLEQRVLFMTGDVLGKDTQMFLKIAGNKFIEKPFEINKLIRIVRKITS